MGQLTAEALTMETRNGYKKKRERDKVCNCFRGEKKVKKAGWIQPSLR